MPTSTSRSPLRYPLDLILGTEARVRILRVMIDEVDTAMGVTDIAQLAELTVQGTRKALEQLKNSGIIQRIGQGRTLYYELRENDTIISALKVLFQQEREHCDLLISSIVKNLADLTEITEAWLEKLPTDTRSPLTLLIIAEVTSMTWITDEIRSRLSSLEKEFNLIIEVKLHTRADAIVAPKYATWIRAGHLNNSNLVRHKAVNHSQIEDRSLRLSCAIARLLRTEPSLLTRAKKHLTRLLADDHGMAQSAVAEWLQLLQHYSLDRLCDFLEADNSRAKRLRQSSPFFAVLTADEQNQLLYLLEDDK